VGTEPGHGGFKQIPQALLRIPVHGEGSLRSRI
jgi:hypothetical protein